MHVNREQATTMLDAVRYTRALVESFDERDIDHDLPNPNQLHRAEMMLQSALDRIRDLEQRRATR